MRHWKTCGFWELTSWRWHELPLLNCCEHFRATHVLGDFHTPGQTSPSLDSHSHFIFSLFCSSVSKPHPHWSIIMLETAWKGPAFISNTLGFSVPIHFISSMGFGLPISLSICLDSNVPACGWLDSWHGIDSPNNARGLHGQAALHSQRHLSQGRSLLSESQGDTAPFTLDCTCRNVDAQTERKSRSQKENKKQSQSIHLAIQLTAHSGLGSGG